MPRKKPAKTAKTAKPGKVAKAAKPVERITSTDAVEFVEALEPAKPGKPITKELIERWHDLSRRRLRAFVELYRSGQWTLFYESQEQFAALMLQVIETEKTWAAHAGAEPASDADLRSVA